MRPKVLETFLRPLGEQLVTVCDNSDRISPLLTTSGLADI